MVYELRHYDAAAGKFAAMRRRFETEVIPRFAAHGIELLGVFTSSGTGDRISYITRYRDEESRKAAWASFGADPGWKAAKAMSETDGPLLATQTVVLLDPIVAGLPLS